MVFEYGSKGEKFYIIIEGKVAVLVPATKEKDEDLKFVKVLELTSGNSFGELALIKDQPRAASIVCLTDCHFAVLRKKDYLKILGKAESRKLEGMIIFLKGVHIFKDWTKRKLEKMTYFFNLHEYKRKQIVFSEEETPKFVYVVYKGEFELIKEVSVGKGICNGQKIQAKIALLNSGEIFGEKEALLNEKYSFSCSCYSTTGELLKISVEHFLLKIEKDLNFSKLMEKRKNKYRIREKRFNLFKKAITEPDSMARPLQNYSSKPASNALYRKSHSPNVAKQWEYSPLTIKKLASIKKKALGYKDDHKIYFDIHASFETQPTGQVYRACTPGIDTDRTLFEMKCHRPGGYYRANLKKPRPQSRNASEIIYI